MYNSFISWSYLIKLEVFKLEKEIIIIKDDRKTIFPCARHKLHLSLFSFARSKLSYYIGKKLIFFEVCYFFIC